MRAASLVIALSAFAAFAACGGTPGKSICDNTVPPPAACMSQCDPSPSAPNTCPSGYHCAADGFCDARCTPGGGECGDGYECTADGRCKGEGECEGIECNITDCQKQGMPETSISGTVYAPNGTLPLYGITVYIPNQPLPPFTEGAQCSRCNEDLPGQPLARATTDEAGNFTIQGNVPDGANIPLVITSGKWRRQITIPNVAKCGTTALPAADTRLPRNRSEGDIPAIALSTGGADALECIVRRLGIDDSEIGTAGGAQRVHLYGDLQAPDNAQGVDRFASNFPGGSGMFADSQTMWNSEANLKKYDIVILSCEGDHFPATKSQAAMNAMEAYTNIGGRVFMSHWHNIWIGGSFKNGGQPQIAAWNGIANWNEDVNLNSGLDIIDEVSNPKGMSFATWMLNVGGSTTRGQININTYRITSSSLDPARAERWTYTDHEGAQKPQNFQFTTPQNTPADQRCGKVVFSDMHVSGNGGSPGDTYPNSCGDAGTPNQLSAQEKALAFMLFDLASCVGVIL